MTGPHGDGGQSAVCAVRRLRPCTDPSGSCCCCSSSTCCCSCTCRLSRCGLSCCCGVRSLPARGRDRYAWERVGAAGSVVTVAALLSGGKALCWRHPIRWHCATRHGKILFFFRHCDVKRSGERKRREAKEKEKNEKVEEKGRAGERDGCREVRERKTANAFHSAASLSLSLLSVSLSSLSRSRHGTQPRFLLRVKVRTKPCILYSAVLATSQANETEKRRAWQEGGKGINKEKKGVSHRQKQRRKKRRKVRWPLVFSHTAFLFAVSCCVLLCLFSVVFVCLCV